MKLEKKYYENGKDIAPPRFWINVILIALIALGTGIFIGICIA
ncbi:MAG: hypothetical protein OXB93_01165 [Cytophagales bacterium]|nr:hypothetical protein [Cytophagales bacterium]